MPALVRQAAAEGAAEAVAALRRIVAPPAEGDAGPPAAAVVLAARELLDRGFGRAAPENLTAEPGGPAVGGAGLELYEMEGRLRALFLSRVAREVGPDGQVVGYRLADGRLVGWGQVDGAASGWVAGIVDVLLPGAPPLALPCLDAPGDAGGGGLIGGRHPDDVMEFGGGQGEG
jgi:hypothetical protein